MKITPVDVRNQEFKRVLRGYDPVEVDTFMDMLATEFEDQLQQAKEMRDRVMELETQMKDYKQIEKTLQQTLLQAQEATGRTYESARREAETIVRDAESRAAKTVEQSYNDVGRLTNQIGELKARRESLVARLRVLLSSELDMIKALEMGGDTSVSTTSTLEGTGKPSIELTDILKNIDDDGTSTTH
jgi:cell division initiation protein